MENTKNRPIANLAMSLAELLDEYNNEIMPLVEKGEMYDELRSKYDKLCIDYTELQSVYENASDVMSDKMKSFINDYGDDFDSLRTKIDAYDEIAELMYEYGDVDDIKSKLSEIDDLEEIKGKVRDFIDDVDYLC